MIQKILEMPEGTKFHYPQSERGTESVFLRVEGNKFVQLVNGRMLIPGEKGEGKVIDKKITVTGL